MYISRNKICIILLSFFTFVTLCGCNSNYGDSKYQKFNVTNTNDSILECENSNSLIITSDYKSNTLTNSYETKTNEDSISYILNEEKTDDSSSVAKLRVSNGYYNYSFDGPIDGVVASKEKEYIDVVEGDVFGNLIVKKVITNGDMTQVVFNGELVLSGILYRESGNSDIFSDSMENDWLLFFPDPNSTENIFLLGKLTENISFYDLNNNFSLCADTEPILLANEILLPLEIDSMFECNDFVYTTLKLDNYQIRENLNWFALPYESTATLIDFVIE